MELKILFYIVSIIIYFIYSANKASKKRKVLQEQKNSTPPQQSWEDELKEILQRTIAPQAEQRETYQEEEEYVAPLREEPLDTLPKKSEAKIYEEEKAYDWAMYKGNDMYSVESDSTTLATHIAELEAAMERQPDAPSVALNMIEQEGFDARKAFLYAEIFRAPYLEDMRY